MTKKGQGNDEDDWGEPSQIITSAEPLKSKITDTQSKDPLSQISEPEVSKEKVTELPPSIRSNTDWGDDDPPTAPPPPVEAKETKRSPKRNWLVAKIVGMLVLVALAVLTFYSWQNSRQFFLNCEEKSVLAEKGSFWPYGVRPLDNKLMPSFTLTGQTPCVASGATGKDMVIKSYLLLLTKEATERLLSNDNDVNLSSELLIASGVALSKRSPEYANELTDFNRLQNKADAKAAHIMFDQAIGLLESSTKRIEAVPDEIADPALISLKVKIDGMLNAHKKAGAPPSAEEDKNKLRLEKNVEKMLTWPKEPRDSTTTPKPNQEKSTDPSMTF